MDAAQILSEKEARALLEDILAKEGLAADELIIDEGTKMRTENYLHIMLYDFKKGKQKGDGYLSCITKLDITDKTKGRKLHLVVKCAPKNPQFRDMCKMDMIYQREIKFYEQIWPAYVQLQKEHQVKEPLDAVAKCYKTGSDPVNEYLVLENIKMQNYKLWNRFEVMNDQHIEYLMKQYGKFHALSYALKHHKPDVHAALIEDLDEIFNPETMSESFRVVFNAGVDGIKKNFTPDSDIYATLERLQANLFTAFFEMTDKTAKFAVITHGDCWCNNMMFKYDKDPLTPTGIRLLDFQIIRHASPVLDLSYFFYISGDPEKFDDIEDYLKIYHASLINYLEALHVPNAANFMTFDNLLALWKKYAQFGLMMSSVVMRAAMSEVDEVVELNNLDETNMEDTMTNFVGRERKYDKIINARLKKLTEHLYKRGCLEY